MYRTVN